MKNAAFEKEKNYAHPTVVALENTVFSMLFPMH